MNGNGNTYDGDLESLKQEILREVRKELYKVKAEIIEGKFILTLGLFLHSLIFLLK